MHNTTASKAKNKKLLIAIVSCVLAVAIIVPVVLIAVFGGATPLKFLMKNDLSEYVNVSIPEKIDYNEIKEELLAGYDIFRVGITETYFGTTVYVEEGSTMDFILSAELVTEKENGLKEYTEIDLPEQYEKIEGYRPYSKEENLFFDDALAKVGDKDDMGIDYMKRNEPYKFTMTVPDGERFGEYAGKKIRFTIRVLDYVARYVYIYGGADNSVGVIGGWYSKIAMALAKPSADATIEEGDVIVYDCIDTYNDGTVQEYLDINMEVTKEYLSYFEGRKAGDVFTEELQGISEKFTIKAIYKSADIEAGINELGYDSVYDMKEELRVWCYAVYSDGIMAVITKKTELISYPEKLVNTFEKLEDQTWEVEFRESALALAQTVGDKIALETYGVTEFETVQAYLDDMMKEHVNTIVRELVIAYSIAKQYGLMDSLYERYETSIKNYMEQQNLTKREALESLSANADEACVLYSNFMSPILGVKFAEIVEGANFTEFIADGYVK